jgi:hypothetical protein
MPLQNRVSPSGHLLALPGRGLFLGNRGVLHDAAGRITRFSEGRRWIVCLTEYRGLRRAPMPPGGYTALFFLDEAVALAAGHRPCARCRPEAWARFQASWRATHGAPADCASVDTKLHAERLLGGRQRRTYSAEAKSLPDGAFVQVGEYDHLVLGAWLLEWSAAGYWCREPRPGTGTLTVVTPRATVACLAAGYTPVLHPSASLREALPRRREALATGSWLR